MPPQSAELGERAASPAAALAAAPTPCHFLQPPAEHLVPVPGTNSAPQARGGSPAPRKPDPSPTPPPARRGSRMRSASAFLLPSKSSLLQPRTPCASPAPSSTPQKRRLESQLEPRRTRARSGAGAASAAEAGVESPGGRNGSSANQATGTATVGALGDGPPQLVPAGLPGAGALKEEPAEEVRSGKENLEEPGGPDHEAGEGVIAGPNAETGVGGGGPPAEAEDDGVEGGQLPTRRGAAVQIDVCWRFRGVVVHMPADRKRSGPRLQLSPSPPVRCNPSPRFLFLLFCRFSSPPLLFGYSCYNGRIYRESYEKCLTGQHQPVLETSTTSDM